MNLLRATTPRNKKQLVHGRKMFDCRAILLATVLIAWVGVAHSQTKPQPNNESGTLSAQQGSAQPTPSPNSLSQEQVTKAVEDGIDAAAKEYETRHPSPPPDNSGWWFNFWLVVFTGGLVAVGASQCYLILWTLRATEKAANAAVDSAKTAEKGMLTLEIPYLYPFVRQHGFITNVSQRSGQLAVTSFDFGNEFIKYYFRNFGRTPAEITEVQSILLPSMGMPNPWPATDRNLNRLSGYIVAADGGESPDFPYAFNKGMFDNYSQGKFNPDTHMFWFLGTVRYNDVFENEYIRGFCLAYSPMTNNFYPVGGDGYNYRRKTKAAGQEA